MSKREQQFPFGSIVPYDVTPEGALVIYISFIAEHYKNLEANSHACVTVVDPFGSRDPQAHARASILLQFQIAEKEQKKSLQQSYEKRFPSSINYDIAHNFCFMTGVPQKVRWIKGFGDMGWITQEQYQEAAVDPLVYQSYEIIEHMNHDHPDALVDYVHAFSDVTVEGSRVEMRGIDVNGMDLAVLRSTEVESIRVDFLEPLKHASEAREATIELLKEARKRLAKK